MPIGNITATKDEASYDEDMLHHVQWTLLELLEGRQPSLAEVLRVFQPEVAEGVWTAERMRSYVEFVLNLLEQYTDFHGVKGRHELNGLASFLDGDVRRWSRVAKLTPEQFQSWAGLERARADRLRRKVDTHRAP